MEWRAGLLWGFLLLLGSEHCTRADISEMNLDAWHFTLCVCVTEFSCFLTDNVG
jgi:hypothetical protein